MKKSFLLMGIVLLVIFQSCTKNGDPISPAYKAYMTQITVPTGTTLVPFSYSSTFTNNKLSGFRSIIAGDFKISDTLISCSSSGTIYDYHINLDASGKPVSAKRAISASFYVTGYKPDSYIDSVDYRYANGKLSYIVFFDRATIAGETSRVPGAVTKAHDTIEVFRLEYTNENISRISYESRIPAITKTIIYEYMYGSEKGTCYDVALPYMTIPDKVIADGYGLLSLYVKNNLSAMRITSVTAGNSKTLTTYDYTYNSYKYPETIAGRDSATNVKWGPLTFNYLQ